MNEKQFMKWYLELSNQEYNNNAKELDEVIMLVEDNQIYM